MHHRNRHGPLVSIFTTATNAASTVTTPIIQIWNRVTVSIEVSASLAITDISCFRTPISCFSYVEEDFLWHRKKVLPFFLLHGHVVFVRLHIRKWIYVLIFRHNQLPSNADFHLFKVGIKPKWEDRECANGGKWTVSSSRKATLS
ncbi:uncharacterized protein LOC116003945 [Ipomoea triloba]|uniref:uncharacterized protein LOC116003945 n=1 Tax=Ipomoea triloba TaxID=35885 RepID=UPI00125E4F5A|nr:uncharacterized protein LOC116003945 [Ipomoea triloba]